MADNVKHKKLNGIEATMKAILFRDLLQEMISKRGGGTLADEVGMDPSQLSNFKNGKSGIMLADLEKLLEISDAVIVTRKRFERNLLCTLTLAENLSDFLGLD